MCREQELHRQEGTTTREIHDTSADQALEQVNIFDPLSMTAPNPIQMADTAQLIVYRKTEYPARLPPITPLAAQSNVLSGNTMQLGWDSVAFFKKSGTGFHISGWASLDPQNGVAVTKNEGQSQVEQISTRITQSCTVVIISDEGNTNFMFLHINSGRIATMQSIIEQHYKLGSGRFFISRISGTDGVHGENGTAEEKGFEDFLKRKITPQHYSRILRGNYSDDSFFNHEQIVFSSDLSLTGDFCRSTIGDLGGFTLDWNSIKSVPQVIKPLEAKKTSCAIQ